MTGDWGPERAEAIRVLQKQTRNASVRLEAIGLTADAEEASYEARDAAGIEYGELKDELALMRRDPRA